MTAIFNASKGLKRPGDVQNHGLNPVDIFQLGWVNVGISEVINGLSIQPSHRRSDAIRQNQIEVQVVENHTSNKIQIRRDARP